MVAPLNGEGTVEHIHFIVRVHQAHMTYRHLLAIWKKAGSLGMTVPAYSTCWLLIVWNVGLPSRC
jgi:hypothetical protein